MQMKRHRVVVLMDDEQREALRREAKARGVSEGEVMRRALAGVACDRWVPSDLDVGGEALGGDHG